MALRKIKDLIREMIFENQAHEHEYANVMATLVFDRGAAESYEQQLSNAENSTQQYNEKIQKINRALKKKDEKIQTQKSLKGKLNADEFKSGMAKLNKQKGILKNLQDQTIATKIQSGFAGLDPVVKKYAVLRYLANTCITNEDFPVKTDSNDAFLYADEYEFKSSSTALNFREIADYVDYIFGNWESKITEPSSVVEIIKGDAKQLGIEFNKLTPDNIVHVYNSLLARIAEENRKKQTEQKQIDLSQIGLQAVQDFGNGLVMYRLLPDTEYYHKHGEHRNLVYESDQMGICIGNKGQQYSKKIFEDQENQYYTLRSRQSNGQLIPHCTIEVNGRTIRQVKGKANGPVNGNYIQYVREFLKTHLNAALPGDKNTGGKRSVYDITNIGFLQDINNRYVDIFNLPPDTEFKSLSYDLLMTSGVDIDHIKSIQEIKSVYGGKVTIQPKVIELLNKIPVQKLSFMRTEIFGDADFSGVKELNLSGTDLSNVTSIKFNPNAKKIDLIDAKGLKGDLDFSRVEELDLSRADLTNVTSIKFNSNAKKISVQLSKGLKGDLDFSKVEELNLGNADLLNVTNIKFNPNAKKINLSPDIYATSIHLKGNLDFSGVEELSLLEPDLTDVTSIKFNPIAKKIDLIDAKGLKGDLDFSRTEELNLAGTDLTNVTSIKFNPNAKMLALNESFLKYLNGDLDFSGIERLCLFHADLTNVTSIKFNPNADAIELDWAKGLKGDLDFSGVKELNLFHADLTDVTSIKFNPNAKKIELRRAKGLHGNLDFNGVEELDLRGADLKNVKKINLRKTRVLQGDLDFSGIEELTLTNVNLTDVTSIKFNPNAKKLVLGNDLFTREDEPRTQLKGDLDFSGVEELGLDFINLADVTSIKFNPIAKKIDLIGARGLKGDLDFSRIEELNLVDTDLTNITSIKFNPHAKKINLCGTHPLQGDLDFSGVEELYLNDAELSDVTSIKFNPHAKKINLRRAKVLTGDLDFSKVEELDLTDADLTGVTSIKFNPRGTVKGISRDQRLHFAKNRVVKKIRSMFTGRTKKSAQNE